MTPNYLIAEATDSDYVLVSSYGLGDTYIVASLCDAFRRKYCTDGRKLFLVVKESHRDLAKLFAGGWNRLADIPDSDINSLTHAAAGRGVQILRPGVPVFVHPSVATVRPDHCVAHHFMSDVAMYALIMGLHPATVPTLPRADLEAAAEAKQIAADLGVVEGKTVLLIPHANSWLNTPTSFWHELAARLQVSGRVVLWNDPTKIPLRCVAPLAALAGWVIGANCGLMQTIVCGQVPCRKTIVTQSLEGSGHTLPISSTFPYRMTRKIDGNTYDIEEFLTKSNNHSQVLEMIVNGRNAHGPEPTYAPLTRLETQSTPGDIIDRLTILRVKAAKLPSKAHLLYRETDALQEVRDHIVGTWPNVAEQENELFRLNQQAWDANEVLIDAFAAGIDPAEWSETSRTNVLRSFRTANDANQCRIRIKNKIEDICGAGSKEQKSYD